jgi:glycosyltransferase involved in cell wall biosynthesis
MKIVYVCADRGIPVLGGKGASAHVRQITSALSARGHDMHLLCRSLGSGNVPPAVATIEQCDTDSDFDRALSSLTRNARVDAVIERYSLESGAARRTSRRLGIPLVLEVNAPLVREASRWRGLRDVSTHLERERETIRSADAVVAVSAALVDYVAGRAPAVPVRRVSNGADVSAIAAARAARAATTRSEVVVGFVGSMKPWHGVRELLEAFERVARRHPAAGLVFVGEGPEERALRERADANPDLRERVVFTGAVRHDEVPALLASFDIGAAPYMPVDDFYFSPLKVIEYLAAGLPVVHPSIGELPEIVGDAGLAYDPHRPEALEAALDRLIGDQALRQRCSQAGVARAPEHSWDCTAAAMEDVIGSVTANQVGIRR